MAARAQRAESDFVTPMEKAKAVDLFSRYEKATYESFCSYWAGLNYPIAPCYALREYTHLRPNGDVEVCIWKPVVVGNLKEQSFSEIWGGEIAEKHRRFIRGCTECARVHPNLCDALNNVYFHGILTTRSIKRRFL